MHPASTPISDRHALLGGTSVHWLDAGVGDVLVLIHGSLCDYRYWRWQIPAFSARYRVIAPSLPGCWPEPVGSAHDLMDTAAVRLAAMDDDRYSMEGHIQAVVELCQTTGGNQRVYLLGHSRGAQVALETALALPESVAGLILADPGFSFDDEPPTPAIHTPIAQKLGHAPLDEVLGEFVDTVNGPDTWRRTVPWFKKMVRANAWTLLPQLKDMHRSVDTARLKHDLDCPVMLVSGEHSPPRYGSRVDRLLQTLPGSQHVVVPGAAHGMNLANARYFNDVVMNFLSACQHE